MVSTWGCLVMNRVVPFLFDVTVKITSYKFHSNYNKAMKKFRFFHPTHSPKLMTVEGEIEVDVTTNTSVISDTLAALLGENNLGEIIDDLGADSQIEGMEEADKTPPPPPPTGELTPVIPPAGAPIIQLGADDLEPLEGEDQGEEPNANAEITGDGKVESSAEEQPSHEEILKGLLRSTVEELKALAVEAQLPEAEYAGMNKMNLAKYLIEKLYSQPQ